MQNLARQPDQLPLETPARNVILTDAASLMEVIGRAATDPNVDIDKLERLYGMYERITAQSAKVAYHAALSAMQPKLPAIDENGAIKNNAGAIQSTYALWEDINDAIRPILATHGFALSFKPKNTQGGIEVTAILSHSAGHSEEATLALQADTSGSKNGVQALGSSVSYAKRYTAMGLLNITSRAKEDRDDDGQKGGARGQSAAVSAAITAINLCADAVELKNWKGANAEMLASLPQGEADAIVRVWNTRARKVREAKEGAPS